MGKIELEVSRFKSLFWEVAEDDNSYKHVFGRDGKEKEEIQHYNESLPKKVRYINDVDFLYKESSCGFVPQ